MSQHFRHLGQIVVGTLLLLCGGVPAAFAGPVPIESEPPAPAAQTDGGGFPWLETVSGALLAIAVVGLIVVLWHRANTAGGRRLATP